jgi:ADP-heptose:LPS heptosyltransferase
LTIRYLIIRFSSIGDIVLTSPVVRCLKQQVEGAEIHYVTKHKYASLVSSNPSVDKVHLFSGNMKDLIASLEAEKFDYIIDLHNNFRSNRIKHILGIPYFTFQKLNIEKFLLVNFKINRLPDKHVVDRYMKTLQSFNVKNDGQGLDYFIPDNECYNTEKLPPHFRNGYIAFVIAGTWNTKKLPAELVADICNRVDYPVVLIGGKYEQRDGEVISALSNGNVLNFTGKLSLNESSSLVRDANLVLTNDTGLMHIAAAFRRKILSFWGNTVPVFGMSPYLAHPASELMEVHGLRCRPCSKLGYQSCPKKHFQCMKNQNVEKAVYWINQNFTS